MGRGATTGAQGLLLGRAGRARVRSAGDPSFADHRAGYEGWHPTLERLQTRNYFRAKTADEFSGTYSWVARGVMPASWTRWQACEEIPSKRQPADGLLARARTASLADNREIEFGEVVDDRREVYLARNGKRVEGWLASATLIEAIYRVARERSGIWRCLVGDSLAVQPNFFYWKDEKVLGILAPVKDLS